MKKGYIIAIDGPVASGKGTIAKKLAQKIHAFNFNSGGVYRAYAYKLLQHGVKTITPETFITTIHEGDVEIIVKDDSGGFDITLDGMSVTDVLTTPEISMASSTFSKNKYFVEMMSKELRRNAKNHIDAGHGIIMEGRQIGTEVYPDADVKIFLTADLDTRAKRRLEQYRVKDLSISLAQVIEETRTRDEQDMNREFGALPRYPEQFGYDIIDNSQLNESETLDAILTVLKNKKIWTDN
jgi:cytidylate kinase